MPKRRNPFGEITPLQRKTHVGFDQMATPQEKQKVYEKTKALLFQGANPTSGKAAGLAVPTPHRANGDHCGTTGGPQRTNNQPQLFASNEQLSAFTRIEQPPVNGAVSNGAGCVEGGKAVQQPGLLNYFTSHHTSLRTGGAQGGREGRGGGGRWRRECGGCRRQCEGCLCDHCERSVCGDCSRQCYQCQSTFCSNCSVLNYDEAVLRSFCLNCLSHT